MIDGREWVRKRRKLAVIRRRQRKCVYGRSVKKNKNPVQFTAEGGFRYI